MRFVLDNSVAMLWLLPQSNPSGVGLAEAALTQLATDGAAVPQLWQLEAANVLAKSQRLEKITRAQASAFVTLLESLDIATDSATARHALHDTLELARQFNLSAYDAAYLELALREGLRLATLDARLAAAAREAGVLLVGEL